MAGTSRCRSCGAAILWATTPSNKSMPLDAEPHPEGTIQAVNGEAVTLRFSELAVARAERVPLYRSHFGTCPNAALHQKAK